MIAAVDASTWLAVTALASLSILSAALGVGLASWVGPRSVVRAAGVGFSVGVMVAISSLELLPEAAREAGVVVAAVAASTGAGLLAVLHAVIPHVHLVAEDSALRARELRRVYLVAFGLILHDFPEGFAMANAYLSAPRLGVVVAIAIVLHNIPEEFAMSLPAVMARRRRFLIGAAAVSAAAEPVGALLGLAVVGISPGLNAMFLAFAAGAMVFVAVHELVPLSRELGRRRDTAVGIAAGVGVVVLLGLLTSA
ncbi:MAG: ZIP family metal transporter [Acidimicrobiales bacterium]|nr:ZIP family metal transporter [Acidimicrobiales bacterium]